MDARSGQVRAISATLILETARSFVGTRFQHQARLKGVAVDCVGLLVCVARELGIQYTDYINYKLIPTEGMLVPHLAASLQQIDEFENACVCAFWWASPKDPPYHCGILDVPNNKLIHTYRNIGRVTEHGFDERWRKRVHSIWRYPWRQSH